MANLAIVQRNQARFVAIGLEEELKKQEGLKGDPPPENSGYGKVAAQLGTDEPSMTLEGELNPPTVSEIVDSYDKDKSNG